MVMLSAKTKTGPSTPMAFTRGVEFHDSETHRDLTTETGIEGVLTILSNHRADRGGRGIDSSVAEVLTTVRWCLPELPRKTLGASG